MQNTEKLICFIRENSNSPNLYWYPLVKLKYQLPVAAFNLTEIYDNLAISSLEEVFRSCGISSVYIYQADHPEHPTKGNLFTLLHAADDDGYIFPWCAESFYYDESRTWLVYVSHEGTISFTGAKIKAAAAKYISEAYRLPQIGDETTL